MNLCDTCATRDVRCPRDSGPTRDTEVCCAYYPKIPAILLAERPAREKAEAALAKVSHDRDRCLQLSVDHARERDAALDEAALVVRVLRSFSCSHESPDTCPWGSGRSRVTGLETGCAECAHGYAKRVLASLSPAVCARAEEVKRGE